MGFSEAAAIYRNAVLLRFPPGAQRKLPVIWIWLTVSLGCGVLPVLLHKVCLGWTTSHEQTPVLQCPKQAAFWVPGGRPSQAAPGFLCSPRAGGGSSQFTKISRGRWSRRVGVGSHRRAEAQAGNLGSLHRAWGEEGSIRWGWSPLRAAFVALFPLSHFSVVSRCVYVCVCEKRDKLIMLL